MPSVMRLLEQRELAARRRVEELREEADRIQAEPAVAERDWQEWAIARSRVGEVLAPAEEVGRGWACRRICSAGSSPSASGPGRSWTIWVMAAAVPLGGEGHTRVPKKWVETVRDETGHQHPLKLGIWLSNQRQRRDTLPTERAQALEELEA